MDRTQIAALARELVMNIKNRQEILAAYELTEAELQAVEGLDYFKRASEQIAIEWNKVLSTPTRVKLISLAMLEDGMPTLGGRMIDPKEQLTSAVEAAKFLARVAGLGSDEQQGAGASADKFIIQINMGGGEAVTFAKTIDTSPVDSEVVELPALPKT